MPSRRRPASLQRFFAAHNATGGSTPGMVLIDSADYADNCKSYDALELPPGWFFHYTHGETQHDKIAEIWDQVVDCSWLGLIGDDCVPETPQWDAKMLERLNGANLVSCNDGHQAPRRVGNCWMISGPLVRAVGYIFPPGLQHLYVDDVWEIIGTEAGCWAKAMDVMVRHRHVLFGEAPADETYEKTYGKDYGKPGAAPTGMWPADGKRIFEWMGAERDLAVAAARSLQPKSSSVEVSTLQHPAVHTHERSAEERFAYAKTRKVMILTPIARAPCWQYTWAFGHTISVLERAEIEWDVRFVIGLSNLPRARNELAARFMARAGGDPTWDAMWIDDDMDWEPGSIIRLIASTQPFVGAAGRKRIERPNTDPTVWCAYLPQEGQERDEMGNISGPDARVGGAFVKISQAVFASLGAAHPEWKRPGQPHMTPEVAAQYFQFYEHDDRSVVTPEMLNQGNLAIAGGCSAEGIFKAMLAAAPQRNDGGEDFTFCDRWSALGGKVWIDPTITLGHVGEHEYIGALGELSGVPPEANPHMAALANMGARSIAA